MYANQFFLHMLTNKCKTMLFHKQQTQQKEDIKYTLNIHGKEQGQRQGNIFKKRQVTEHRQTETIE
jgi:hypothetical protein